MAEREIVHHASTVTIRTRAKGLLSKLAHDLEIAAAGFSGMVDVREGALHAELRFPVSSLEVVGAVRGDRVDRTVLSADDRAEIERRIKTDVLPNKEIIVTVAGKAPPEAGSVENVDVTVVGPRGRQHLSVKLSTEDRDGRQVGHGTLALSLSALGIKEIKGPLGAFKVDDAVLVAFWIELSR